eukprot:CAMPEP_0173446846 /NCGR_PEP_ID=MMETSP1357-20121228/37466_1 /TAXON_ID=77926 /ORGANISM="Hemiselmis rufescens, Strain PCC563" /LENGTH=153 /DNA_ID=CAMNT_0014413187 /DNA_START=43 /DNA_END=500 /DNA_ORIENTATION=+
MATGNVDIEHGAPVGLHKLHVPSVQFVGKNPHLRDIVLTEGGAQDADARDADPLHLTVGVEALEARVHPLRHRDPVMRDPAVCGVERAVGVARHVLQRLPRKPCADDGVGQQIHQTIRARGGLVDACGEALARRARLIGATQAGRRGRGAGRR